MPTPSPPKRGTNFGGKQVGNDGPIVQSADHEDIEFSVDDSQNEDNPFSQASP